MSNLSFICKTTFVLVVTDFCLTHFVNEMTFMMSSENDIKVYQGTCLICCLHTIRKSCPNTIFWEIVVAISDYSATSSCSANIQALHAIFSPETILRASKYLFFERYANSHCWFSRILPVFWPWRSFIRRPPWRFVCYIITRTRAKNDANKWSSMVFLMREVSQKTES